MTRRALEAIRLHRSFGGLRATDDLSFHVEEGESVGLIGPNGAGKTTVFSLIMGEIPPTSGRIELFGEEIGGLSTSRRIRMGVGRTWQVPRPFAGMSVRRNIRVGLAPDSLASMVFGRPDREREMEIALSVGFSPDDLERSPSELSMGELRKLELARTLATGARILLLDEVFAGLSPGEIEVISDLIGKLRGEGFTFLIVSHDLAALAPLVDRALAIERGRCIAQGSFESVIAHEQVRASYLGGA